MTSLSLSRVCFFRGGLEDNSFWTSTNTGCETVTMNGSVLCSCNHLTHFAVLLSPGVVREREREILRLRLSVRRKGGVSSYNSKLQIVCGFLSLQEIPEIHFKILTIIGYVFVPISLVFLLATIVTYVLLKYKRVWVFAWVDFVFVFF